MSPYAATMLLTAAVFLLPSNGAPRPSGILSAQTGAIADHLDFHVAIARKDVAHP